MTRLDVVKANSRSVVNDSSTATSEVWTYRRLTSNPAVSTRVYDTVATDIYGLSSRGSNNQQYDMERTRFARISSNTFRTADDAATPPLTQGDLLIDAAGKAWAVLGVASSGPGTICYQLGTEEILTGDAARGGGV